VDLFFTRFVLSDDIKPRLSRHTVFWVISWGFQGFIYSFLYVDSPGSLTFIVSFTESLIYLPQHIFLSYTIIYFALPRFIFKGQYWAGLLVIIGLIVVTALLSPLALYYVIEPFRDLLDFPYHFKGIFASFLGGLRGSMTIAGFAVAIKLVKHWYLKKSENEHLEKARLRAELELLKQQLHPHFMFNTLNSIYAMALRNSPQTPDAILQLSNLMRYMIAESGAPTIALSKEVHILRNYMNLEKGRIGDRVDQSLHVEGLLEDKHIAPLLLLPFLENSYKHGVYGSPDSAWLTLDIHVRESELRFHLVNGKGSGAPSSSGIGLQNVKKRLSMLYPGSHDLKISEDDETFVVSLTLMLDKMSIPA
jgi:sensor histidine kinase YesM